MKRFVAIVGFVCCITLLSAQSRLGGGASAGFSMSLISGVNLKSLNKPGAFVGMFANYSFNAKNWLQVELNFIQKGAYQVPKDVNPHKYWLNLNYIELPVLYKFMPAGNRFAFEVGPTFGYLINYKEKSELGDIYDPIKFRKYEVAALAGINYRLGKGGLWLNLRAIQSVVAVRKHQGDATFRLNRGQYNTTVLVSFKYTFPPKANTNN